MGNPAMRKLLQRLNREGEWKQCGGCPVRMSPSSAI